MPQYGVQLKINVILLVGITTFIPRIFSLDDHNLKNHKYDYIDVAKAIAGSRNKGHTTRILTADDDLDEKFWLKYLGEDFRNVVHLQVGHQNNVIPLIDETPPTTTTTTTPPPPPPASPHKHNENTDKRTRFARQPAQEKHDKQLPVENQNQYPNDKTKTLKVNLNPTSNTTTTTTSIVRMTTTLPPANKTHHSYSTEQHFNNKKPSKHKVKLLHPSNKNDKKKFAKAEPWRSPNNMKNPIVVISPTMDSSVDRTNITHVPVMMQKTDNKLNRKFFMDANQLYSDQFPNLYLNDQNVEYYSEQNTQQFYPPHITGYATQSHHTHFTAVDKATTPTTTTPSYAHAVHNT